MVESIEVHPITAEQTLPLRAEVLRPGHPLKDAVFAGDDEPTTQHLGVFAGDALVGVASLYRQPLREEVREAAVSTCDALTWQLRGMAVAPGMQGKGYGRTLLGGCLQVVNDHQGRLLWCNARTSAVGFYRVAGFAIRGEEFLIPSVGPHYVMARLIS